MSYTVWYKDNPQNPTLFFLDATSNGTTSFIFQIMTWIDYTNTNYPYTHFLIPFYVVQTNLMNQFETLMEVNMGISYYSIVNVSNNYNPLYISTDIQSYPNPPSAYFYYLSNFEISLSIDLFTYPCPCKRYVLVVPYNYVFPTSLPFPGSSESTIFVFYFEQSYVEDQCPLTGYWQLTRIVFNSNNGNNSNSNFSAMIQYFIENGIMTSLFETFERTTTNQILPFELVTSLLSKWNYEFPLNVGNVYPMNST